MTPFPTQEPDAGATNMPNPNAGANSSGQDGSGGLRAEMAAVAHAPSRCLLGVDPIEQVSSPFQAVELAVEALFNAGYRLVSVGDDTVERAAEIRALTKTLDASRQHAQRARREGLDEDTCRFWSGVSGFIRSRIRALEAGEEPDWPDAANTARDDLGGAAVQALRDEPGKHATTASSDLRERQDVACQECWTTPSALRDGSGT